MKLKPYSQSTKVQVTDHPLISSSVTPKRKCYLEWKIIELDHSIQVFCDCSGFKEGIGTSEVVYVDDQVDKVLHFYLGSEKKHTVYEAEGLGTIMALHLPKSMNRQLKNLASVFSNGQLLLKALNDQCSHTGHYILDKTYDATEAFHAKQGGLFNRVDHRNAIRKGWTWKGRIQDVIDLYLCWVPGHCDNG
jgi:hypothetical protein